MKQAHLEPNQKQATYISLSHGRFYPVSFPYYNLEDITGSLQRYFSNGLDGLVLFM